MNIDYYRIFLKVAETHSLTATAEQIGYTQSGVSHIVSQLELEFGFPLIMRNKSGAAITQNGEQLLPLIRDIVNRDEQLHQAAADIKGIRAGRLSVGAFTSVAIHWLPKIIKEFNILYPNIEFDISIGDYKRLEDMVSHEEVDCGFTTGTMCKNMDFTPLKQDRLLALLPISHPLANGDSLPIEAIKDIDLIIPGEGYGYDIGRILKQAGIKPNIKYSVSDDYVAISMVENGLGITIMPELIVTGSHGKVAILELEPKHSRTIGSATRLNVNTSPACKAFLEFVRLWVNARLPYES